MFEGPPAVPEDGVDVHHLWPKGLQEPGVVGIAPVKVPEEATASGATPGAPVP